MSIVQDFELTNLDRLLRAFGERQQPLNLDTQLPQLIQALQADQLDLLPLPGQGNTLRRWQTLARVAGCDLALAKLYEGHTDALAILAECAGAHHAAAGIWGVWAAEAPDARTCIVARDGERVRLSGRKAWCSGALQIDRALITAWDAHDQPQLVAIELSHPSQGLTIEHWQAIGMATTASVEVAFNDTPGIAIGRPGQYLSRPGFGMAVPASQPAGTAPPKPWPITCGNTAVTLAPTLMPMPTWARSTPTCWGPGRHCANARRGSTASRGQTLASRCAAAGRRWNRR